MESIENSNKMKLNCRHYYLFKMAAAVPPPLHTVREAMTVCGVNDVDQWQGQTKAQRIASEIFNDDFNSCMDLSISDLSEDFKTFSELLANAGRIRLTVGIKKKIKGFIQWCRDEIRMGRNPAFQVYPVATLTVLDKRMSTHDSFVKNSETMSKAAEPKEFTNDDNWDDWEPIFRRYLRCLVGENGQPLSYVIRDSDAPDPTPHTDFLEMYINMAPLNGLAYEVDNQRVLTLLLKFTKGNDMADGAISALNTEHDGRAAFLAAKVRFQGEGITMTLLVKAEFTIDKLYYTGEKYPSMYWMKFETELNRAYAVVDKQAGRPVHDNATKLRKLQLRIKNAEHLKQTKELVDSRMVEVPMTMTYEQAIKMYRNKTAQVYPKGPQRTNINRRGIAQVTTGGGRGRGGRGGRGYGGRGRGQREDDRQQRRERNRADQEPITLRNGEVIQYHPSYHFSQHEMRQMTEAQRTRLRNERAAYRNSRNNPQRDAQIEELRSVVESLRAEQARVPAEVGTAASQSQISQVSVGTSGSAFGGRARQARNRQQPPE